MKHLLICVIAIAGCSKPAELPTHVEQSAERVADEQVNGRKNAEDEVGASSPPGPAELAKILQPWFDQQTRPAWKPAVQVGDGKLTGSKFGGNPWLSPDESWPQCKGCKRSYELFLQLDLESLPKSIEGKFGKGLLQLFYCRHDCTDAGYEYFDEHMSHVRVVHPDGPGKKLAQQREEGSYPARQIVGWKQLDDLPDSDEHEMLGLNRDFDFDSNSFSVDCVSLGVSFKGMPLEQEYEYDEAVFGRGIPLGDKLGGWPCWIQNASYPCCPKCDARMQFVFQIDSEDNVPFMFGDSGCGYLFQCKEHPSVVAFGWDCH